LPEVKRQYADFARWQRDALRGEELRRQLSFWKQQLSGAPALLDLPTDRPRPPVQSFRGAHHPIALSASLRQALRTVSQREGVTSFMLLLAAFKVLLLRCTGQTDIVVGAPVANREWPEFENTVGYFVNILVLRTRLTHDFTFRELLAQVRQTTLNAQVYQGTPFALLVEAQQPARNLSYNPIFQVMFSAGPVPVPPQLPGLEVSFVEIDTGIYQSADLRLDIEEGPQGLGGTVEYNTDLFETTTIIRLLEDYQTILTNIVTLDAACDQPLAALLPAPQITARPTTTDATSIPNHQVAQRKAAAAQRRAKLSSAQQALLEKRLGSN
jgi:non-ribosomal peptide synthetase component F